MVSDKGILTCLSGRNGKVNWRERLPRNYAASILFGDGKLYISSDRGETQVIKPSKKKPKMLATNKLDSNIQATPAFVDDSIIMEKHIAHLLSWKL